MPKTVQTVEADCMCLHESDLQLCLEGRRPDRCVLLLRNRSLICCFFCTVTQTHTKHQDTEFPTTAYFSFLFVEMITKLDVLLQTHAVFASTIKGQITILLAPI